MKPTEQYFPVVLFIMLYKVILTFETVDEILKCDHSNESYWAVLSCGSVYYAVQSASNFWVCRRNPYKWQHSNESYWAECFCGYVIMLYKFALTLEIKATEQYFYVYVVIFIFYLNGLVIWPRHNFTIIKLDTEYSCIMAPESKESINLPIKTQENLTLFEHLVWTLVI